MSALLKFLSKRARELSMERQAALRAVREAIKNAGDKKPIDFGSSLHVYDGIPGKVVKTAPSLGLHHWATEYKAGRTSTSPFVSSQTSPAAGKEMKRRAFMKSILEEHGLSPKTYLIETKGRKYLVQDKADKVKAYGQYPYQVDEKAVDDVYSKGITARDTFGHNLGWFGDKPKVIDVGHETMVRAMTPAERKSALEKFISYGKRKKPWLDE